MPVHRRRSSLSTGRRRTTWATFDDSVSVATGGTHYQTNNMLTNYAGAGGSIAGITILRTHLRLTQTSTVVVGDNFYFGVIRGQNEDVGADIAGAPRPLNDFYEDWAWWAHLSAQASGGGAAWSVASSNIMALDLKSRRKLPELQMTWNYVLQVGTAGTSPATFRVAGRALIALP
jgi:hypothetical protein